jgi:putative acetyltransferase
VDYEIQEIKPKHDVDVYHIIKKVGEEYGAIGDGFGSSDLEVNAMSQHYNNKNASRYLVATVDGKIVGGSGVAGFNGSNDICELRSYFYYKRVEA